MRGQLPPDYEALASRQLVPDVPGQPVGGEQLMVGYLVGCVPPYAEPRLGLVRGRVGSEAQARIGHDECLRLPIPDWGDRGCATARRERVGPAPLRAGVSTRRASRPAHTEPVPPASDAIIHSCSAPTPRFSRCCWFACWGTGRLKLEASFRGHNRDRDGLPTRKGGGGGEEETASSSPVVGAAAAFPSPLLLCSPPTCLRDPCTCIATRTPHDHGRPSPAPRSPPCENPIQGEWSLSPCDCQRLRYPGGRSSRLGARRRWLASRGSRA